MSKQGRSTSFDYVIVGPGSAGCVIATRLSEDTSVSVLLVEAGPSDELPDIDAPVITPQLLDGPYDWSFRTEPESGLDGRVMTLNHERIVGRSCDRCRRTPRLRARLSTAADERGRGDARPSDLATDHRKTQGRPTADRPTLSSRT